MGHYSIKDLEGFTGIKAHTLRIWEQRYNLLEPERTETNIRLYNDQQLKTLLNAVMLYKNGYKISHIALLKENNINEEIAKIVKSTTSNDSIIDALVVCMINMDEEHFEELLTNSIDKNGFESTIIDVIYPFFERVGILWLTDVINPAQEHFVSNLIRQKMIVAIDKLGVIKDPGGRKCIAFLHEEELHEIGLLLYTYFLKKNNFKVIYLGQVVPYDDVKTAIQKQEPNVILTGFVKPMESNWINQYIGTLLNDFENITVLSTGFQSSLITLKNERLHLISSINDFNKVIQEKFKVD